MPILLQSSYQIPANISINAYHTGRYIGLGRFPSNRAYVAGNLAASGVVALVAGIVNQTLVILRVVIGTDANANLRLREAASDKVGLYVPANNTITVDMFPYGETFSSGTTFNLFNGGGAAVNYHATVWYCFDDG